MYLYIGGHMSYKHNLTLTTEQLNLILRFAQIAARDLDYDLENQNLSEPTAYATSRARDVIQALVNECKQTLEDPSNAGHI